MSTRPTFPSKQWTPEAIARRVRDQAMLRHLRRGGSPQSNDIRMPKWLQEAQS